MIGKQRKMLKKSARYAAVLEFFNSLPEKQGWTLLQFNFEARSLVINNLYPCYVAQPWLEWPGRGRAFSMREGEAEGR
jgi:hypothetical protein